MRLSRLMLFAFACSGLALCQQGGVARLGANAPSMGYKEVPDWPAQAMNAAGTPAGPWNFIQVSGVAVDSRGRILVLHRGAQPLLEYESNGKFVRSWNSVTFSEGKVAAIAPGNRISGRSHYSARLWAGGM